MSDGRVSVIVPNFNNGRQSARDGRRDFLAELLRSLRGTLSDDPELLEILVADDGSTDDSLATAREWSRRTWPDGRPFLRLIELPHSGVLSGVLNRLLAEARGRVIARLDGDVFLRTARWASLLCRVFDRDERIGVVTGLQLRPDGTVHAFGDDLWGPRGYRHVAAGARPSDVTADREVDHAMGCFYATRREVESTAGRYDERMLRGQTEEYGIRVRLAGWKVVATPTIAFEHWHAERAPRPNQADRGEALDEALDRFRSLWGFDRLAPDLEDVRRRWGRTPLWWRDWSERGTPSPADEWDRLATDPTVGQRLAEEFDLVASVLRAASGPCLVSQIGSGCGCLGHTIARAGATLEGYEERGDASAAASRAAPLVRGPGRCDFAEVEDLAWLPLPAASRSLVCLFGVLERYWNPVGLLRECRRILAPGGVALVRTQLRPTAMDDPDDEGHRFTANEFLTLLRHVGVLRTIGFDPRITASGWLECCVAPAEQSVGRGYFAKVWEAEPAAMR